MKKIYFIYDDSAGVLSGNLSAKGLDARVLWGEHL